MSKKQSLPDTVIKISSTPALPPHHDGAALPNSDSPPSTPITRFHRTRLMQIWRSAGWPCKDGLEIDLLAAGLISLHIAADGCETLRLTDEGIRTLAQARQRGVRALSLHDRLGRSLQRSCWLRGASYGPNCHCAR